MEMLEIKYLSKYIFVLFVRTFEAFSTLKQLAYTLYKKCYRQLKDGVHPPYTYITPIPSLITP